MSAYEQGGVTLAAGLANAFTRGLEPLTKGEAAEGAMHFAKGAGRHGKTE